MWREYVSITTRIFPASGLSNAQCMGFSLEDISRLLVSREQPQQAKPEIRLLANAKLADIKSIRRICKPYATKYS